jgi:hypothetical protein
MAENSYYVPETLQTTVSEQEDEIVVSERLKTEIGSTLYRYKNFQKR